MTDVLEEQVLVLNKNFYALCVVDAREAFRLLTSDKATALDENYVSYHLDSWCENANLSKYCQIRTANLTYAIPEIIRLTSFDKIIEYTLSVTRQNVFYRDNYLCQYCKAQVPKDKLTIDHIIPKSRRREFCLSSREINGWDNIVTSCQSCNTFKDDRTPEEANMKLIKEPVPPKYYLHGFDARRMKQSWTPFVKVEE
jgi:5-methylcytosine-specific restriction endonuclease McrA